MRSSSPKWMDLSDVNPGMARISIVRGTERAGLVCINPQFERFWIMFRLEPGLRSSGPFSPPGVGGTTWESPAAARGFSFGGIRRQRGIPYATSAAGREKLGQTRGFFSRPIFFANRVGSFVVAGEQGFFRLDLIRVQVGAVRPLRGNPHPERRIPYSPSLIAVSFIDAR